MSPLLYSVDPERQGWSKTLRGRRFLTYAPARCFVGSPCCSIPLPVNGCGGEGWVEGSGSLLHLSSSLSLVGWVAEAGEGWAAGGGPALA